jgi:fatty-acid desaturase
MLGTVLAVVGWFGANTALGLGNTVGYHRLLTHRSFKASRPVALFFTLCGAMHGGSPMVWVGLHRLHHTKSDGDGDPHSPRHGFWHAHAGWLIGARHPVPSLLFALSGFGQQTVLFLHDVRRILGRNPPEWRELTPDLMKDPVLRFLDVPFVMPAVFAAQLGLAAAIGGWWGILWLWTLHLVLTNGSWAVNSVCHWPGFGRQPYDNGDDSRDVPWMALITYGEGYHNAHHRYPKSARHGLESPVDLSWWVIRGLERAGLVTDVWLPKAYRSSPVPE